jgi:hypothetical protein
VLTKGVVDVLDDGPREVLRAPELYAWILAALVGTVFQQSSFRASSLTASLPTMTVASMLGVTVLGETLRADGPEVFALVVAVSVVIVATGRWPAARPPRWRLAEQRGVGVTRPWAGEGSRPGSRPPSARGGCSTVQPSTAVPRGRD